MLDLRDRTTLMASLPLGGVGAEIGVAAGDFSAKILTANRPARLYLIDCWDCLPHEAPQLERTNNDLERQYQQVVQRFAEDERVHIMRARSLDAAALFPKNYFDWLYIDANHIDVAQDIVAWLPRVKQGGWMTGHDYVDDDGVANLVKRDVNEHVSQHNRLLLVTADESEQPSWAFQK